MITSKDNNLIKFCNSIKRKKHSRESGFCFVESIKIIKELYEKGLIEHILVTQEKCDYFKKCTCKIDLISNNIANYLSDTMTTDGVFAIAKIKKNSTNSKKCLLLDRLQDPSNLGAIIRSACAFGYNKIYAINSVYPYSAKVIRASMGYIFDVDYNEIEFEDIVQFKQDYNLQIICADMNGENLNNFNLSQQSIVLVIGNEGQGVDKKIMQIADKTIKIPMQNGVESLNASVSAGILMFNLK